MANLLKTMFVDDGGYPAYTSEPIMAHGKVGKYRMAE
jgi:hypothetical protein